MKTSSYLLVSALSLVSSMTLATENAVILEDFEENIDSVMQGNWGGSRIPDGVIFQQYTKTSDEDINVTHGSKSLQVDLSLSEGWVHDFMITLSEEASAKVLEAAKSTDVARFILRYDLAFPPGTSWMNSQVFLGDVNDQLDTPSGANGGMRTMSIALDLVKGLPEEGLVIIRFAENFDATEDPFVGPLSLFVDNIRLVDTYAPGATPVTTVLQGFEDANNPTGGAADFTGWGGTPRTTYSQYAKESPEDIRVTEGDHALKVDFTGPGSWNADFTLPFANTKLAEILKLDLPAEERPALADLARYTLRFDVTYPDRDENGLPGWEVTSYHTLSTGFPFSQARRDGATGFQQTVSITLDQLSAWSDTTEGAPVIMFIAQANWPDAGSTLYYDNFRLIDTGGASTPSIPIKITQYQYDATTSKLTLQWDSNAGKVYTVESTSALPGGFTSAASGIASGGTTTTYTATIPVGTTTIYYRIREQ
ncbi:MAG TPA: hypothetical protein P5186_17655 [Candidatus Paceibacterota bacterium]|nr:hypothetical protein [Candidatus Paceibacterota bacterium]HSA03839.1 hypothetical protein [Candidatus Paceibacterota bacterium]